MQIDLARALKVQGWMSEGELRCIAELASRSNYIFEVGTWKGRATRAMADHMPLDGMLVTIDDWNGQRVDHPHANLGPNTELRERGAKAIQQEMEKNLRDHLDAKRVRFWGMSSHQAFGVLAKVDATFDLLFIDGDHERESMAEDLRLTAFVRPGGVCAGHDYGICSGVTQAVNERFPKVNHVEAVWWTTV